MTATVISLEKWKTARIRELRKTVAISQAREAKAHQYILHLENCIAASILAHEPADRPAQFRKMAAEVAEELRSYSDVAWFNLARKIGATKFASPETRQLVIDYFDLAGRAEVRVCT